MKQKKRTQFKFRWDADDDTSRDYNPLYDVTTQKVGKKREKVSERVLKKTRQNKLN